MPSHLKNNLPGTRRQFIRSATGACLALSIPESITKCFSQKVTISIITDLHQDIMHDAEQRLQSFVTDVKKVKPDAILQMGDFAIPKEANKKVVDLFNGAHKMPLHVLGNHDTDSGFKKEQCLSFWGMPANYYARQINGIWLIVLDGNDKGSPSYKGGYPSYIGPEQINWLKQKLGEINAPAVIVSHQPLAGSGAVDNAAEVQQILSDAKNKVLVAINGHTHIDALYTIGGINYVHINSASYYWAGEKYKHETYPPAVHEQFPWIAYTFPYKDALFATLTIDSLTKKILITGKKSNWEGSTPEQLHYKSADSQLKSEYVAPFISTRKL